MAALYKALVEGQTSSREVNFTDFITRASYGHTPKRPKQNERRKAAASRNSDLHLLSMR